MHRARRAGAGGRGRTVKWRDVDHQYHRRQARVTLPFGLPEKQTSRSEWKGTILCPGPGCHPILTDDDGVVYDFAPYFEVELQAEAPESADFGGAYFKRVTFGRELGADDQDLLRRMLRRSRNKGHEQEDT